MDQINRQLPHENERRAFETIWLDYVMELNGAETVQEAWELYCDERAHLMAKFADGPITGYRAMLYDGTREIPDLAGERHFVGRFWTDDLAVARAWFATTEYSGVAIPDSPVKVIVEGCLTLDDVDVLETVACRLGSAWEREIRTRDGLPVRVVSVDRNPEMPPSPAFRC